MLAFIVIPIHYVELDVQLKFQIKRFLVSTQVTFWTMFHHLIAFSLRAI